MIEIPAYNKKCIIKMSTRAVDSNKMYIEYLKIPYDKKKVLLNAQNV